MLILAIRLAVFDEEWFRFVHDYSLLPISASRVTTPAKASRAAAMAAPMIISPMNWRRRICSGFMLFLELVAGLAGHLVVVIRHFITFPFDQFTGYSLFIDSMNPGLV